jgi:hypothetical protein
MGAPFYIVANAFILGLKFYNKSTMKRKIKDTIQKVKDKPSGHRFQYAYKVIHKDINQKPWLKIGLILLGIFSILMGIILLFIPGPGLLFILIGLICWAILSKKIAKFLDKSEGYILNRFKSRSDRSEK